MRGREEGEVEEGKVVEERGGCVGGGVVVAEVGEERAVEG